MLKLKCTIQIRATAHAKAVALHSPVHTSGVRGPGNERPEKYHTLQGDSRINLEQKSNV
jgi:hypothetical protein